SPSSCPHRAVCSPRQPIGTPQRLHGQAALSFSNVGQCRASSGPVTGCAAGTGWSCESFGHRPGAGRGISRARPLSSPAAPWNWVLELVRRYMEPRCSPGRKGNQVGIREDVVFPTTAKAGFFFVELLGPKPEARPRWLREYPLVPRSVSLES